MGARMRLGHGLARTSLVIALAGALISTGCSNDRTASSRDVAALVAEARALSPEKIETKANEISQNDYRMLRSLMAAGGLDEALGGAARGDAALRALMLDFRRQMLGARADLPRLMKAADEGDAPGLLGLGASFFAGLLATDGLFNVSRESQEASGELGPPAGDGDKNGAFRGSFDESGVTSVSTFEGEISGMKGKVTTKVRLDSCPKADGSITIDFESDSSLTKIGGTAGANVKVTANGRWLVNDDAEFGDGLELDVRVQNAAFGGSRGANGAFIDYSETISSLSAAKNAGKVNRASSKATKDDVATAQAAAQLARLAVFGTQTRAKAYFQSGKCVKLEPVTDPAKRTGVKPKTRFAITAAPRSKLDGTPTGGSVKATLNGAGTLDPAGTKVPADAKFTYVAGDKNTKGSVDFEARSKRGVGKAMLAFDTMNRAYLVEAPGMRGKICNLGEPFTMSGTGFEMKFTPSSERGGRYTFNRDFGILGARTFGDGDYTLDVNENGGTMTIQSTVTFTAPRTTRTFKGKAGTAKLIPTEPC